MTENEGGGLLRMRQRHGKDIESELLICAQCVDVCVCVCVCQVFFGVNVVASTNWPGAVGGVVTVGDKVTVLREAGKEREMEDGVEDKAGSTGVSVGE